MYFKEFSDVNGRAAVFQDDTVVEGDEVAVAVQGNFQEKILLIQFKGNSHDLLRSSLVWR